MNRRNLIAGFASLPFAAAAPLSDDMAPLEAIPPWLESTTAADLYSSVFRATVQRLLALPDDALEAAVASLKALPA